MSVTVFVKVNGRKGPHYWTDFAYIDRKMSHDTQAVLSIQPYHYRGMSIKSLCYGIVWTVYYK